MVKWTEQFVGCGVKCGEASFVALHIFVLCWAVCFSRIIKNRYSTSCRSPVVTGCFRDRHRRVDTKQCEQRTICHNAAVACNEQLWSNGHHWKQQVKTDWFRRFSEKQSHWPFPNNTWTQKLQCLFLSAKLFAKLASWFTRCVYLTKYIRMRCSTPNCQLWINHDVLYLIY